MKQECNNLNNFNAMIEILAGIQQVPIHRLKKTWAVRFSPHFLLFIHSFINYNSIDDTKKVFGYA